MWPSLVIQRTLGQPNNCAKRPRFDTHPKYLIRDNDSKFGAQFARVAASSSIKILKTPFHAPKANAFCERFLGSVRRECLDHLMVLGEQHLLSILKEYVIYFNHARPHQGLRHRIPVPLPVNNGPKAKLDQLQSIPALGGLHHSYQVAA